ncbi:MAG: fibronectin type III domain-containing protein, partial [Clostridia bacterium]|nr:fibronectin type III domain-containing protein [Clostridia bacterium]
TVGNFNGSEDGRQQILVVTGLRAKGNTQKYWYQLSWYSLEGANLIRGNEMIMAHSLSYNNSETDINNSCFVAIAAPDVNDDDSLLLERIGDVQRYYTKPSINAIIQASPYFDDLSSDSYPNEGSTEFGSSTGSTQSGLASCGASAAVKGEVEIELGATIDIETQTTFAFNYDYEYTWANETSVTFGGGTDDYVIMYTTPYSVYSYRMLVSETKKAKVPGSPRYNTYSSYADALLRAQSEPDFYNTSFMPYAAWVELNTDYLKMTPQQIWQNFKPGTRAPKSYFYVEIEEPDNPVTTILTVDQYDEIASRTDGLETIRGTYLNNVPGDPASYANIPTSYHSIHKVGTPRQVGYAEGGYITAEYEVSTEESHEFNFSVEFESSIMVGAGAVGCKAVAGLAGSLSGGGGYAYSDSRGNTYTGTVDSLPKDATDYDFSWQLCKASATINGKEVDIVYYDVKNVRCLPKTPQNLTVSDVSADSVTLTWDNNSSASRFEIYAVNGGGQSLFLDTVIAGASGDTLSYESTGLTAGTTYYYKIRAVNNSGLKSRFSSVVSATTLPDSGGSFGISQQPKDFETFAGDVAIFTVVAYTTNNKPIQYQWQTYDNDAKSWNDIDGKRSATLKVNATPERDGSQYRCIVYQGAGCMVYSSPVELIIGKTGSNTTLTVAKNSPAITIPDGSTVYCAGVKQETITKPLFDWVYDIRTVDENLYTKLAYSESTDTDDNPVY